MINQVKWFQVEATSKCNAWCPGCRRNKGGYELADNLVIEDLNLEVFESTLQQMHKLEVVDFCGTFGDAIAASNIIELTVVAKKYADKIVVRTNGSLRNSNWWANYAQLLADIPHEVWFCLDGLADTHSIYRQATDFDTIIANAKTFISNGGCAVWQFIPWKHNEHQIKDCIRLSQQLGFSRFEFVKDVRKNFKPRDYRTGQVFDIQPWGRDSVMNRYERKKTNVPIHNCRHLSQPSVYLNANGKLSPCCFFNHNLQVDTASQLPDIESELKDPHFICLQYCGQ